MAGDSRSLISRLVPAVNPRTCAPPARPARGSGGSEARPVPHLLIASIPRSGTHLLIDLVLNNFRPYRRSPLYVNLDRWIGSGRGLEAIEDAAPSVLKAHLPAFDRGADDDTLVALQRVAEPAIVLRPVRDRDAVFASYRSMVPSLTERQFAEEANAFERFWGQPTLDVRELPFEDLVREPAAVVAWVAEQIGWEAPRDPILPRPRAARRQIGMDKLLTRMLGARAPVVNTSIRLTRRSA